MVKKDKIDLRYYIPCPNCGFLVDNTSSIQKYLLCPNCGCRFDPIKKKIEFEDNIDDKGEFIEL